MNENVFDVLNLLMAEGYMPQRIIAETCGRSLGIVNKSIKWLTNAGYLDEMFKPTEKACLIALQRAPKNAVILAAGFGMRMVPLNTEVPKGLLEVRGERLIERLIRQLHSAGVNRIYIVVGFMKEKYEYLIDKFGVELIVNSKYSILNNLHSLNLVGNMLSNTYVVPCDIWCAENPFKAREWYSWYLVTNRKDEESQVRVNRKNELVLIKGERRGNAMIGIAYLLEKEARIVRQRMEKMSLDANFNNSFWEDALIESDRFFIPAKVANQTDIIEINTFEELRDVDSTSSHIQNDIIQLISETLSAKQEEIVDIRVLKKGMTNRSFVFTCKDKQYIMRIPGEGTEHLITRKQEAEVYRTVDSHVPIDRVLFIDPDTGNKITEYYQNSRVCDPNNLNDIDKCMAVLRAFHEKKLTVNHTFDIFERLEFYESLWEGASSAYEDYLDTKKNVLSLKPFIEKNVQSFVLSHIDPIPDNFLFVKEASGAQTIRLLDWEYAGMQDPHVDLAMFCIYSLYDRKQIETLIDIYFQGNCPSLVRTKIYCYIAVCGLLWSNWCEYKRSLGVDFGEYSLRQYRFAKDYYRVAQSEMDSYKELK